MPQNHSHLNIFLFLLSQWAGVVPQAAASTPAAASAVDVPSSNSAASSAATVVNQNTRQVKCNWTEHTAPQGFKYYHNSVTGESRVSILYDFTYMFTLFFSLILCDYVFCINV